MGSDHANHSQGKRRRLQGGSSGFAGCVSQGETIREITKNIREAIEGYLSVSVNQTAEGSRAAG
jgi:hypothetical protein